jgi:hypothetical protein
MTITLDLPEDVKSTISLRMVDLGLKSPQEYLIHLLRREAAEHGILPPPGSERPVGIVGREREHLEAMLIEGMQSLERGEGIVMTQEYMDRVRDEARLRAQAKVA